MALTRYGSEVTVEESALTGLIKHDAKCPCLTNRERKSKSTDSSASSVAGRI